MIDAEWRHSDSRQQWELHHDGRIVGTITDEVLPPADAWDDKTIPQFADPWPWSSPPPRTVPGFETLTVPGFQSWVKTHYGVPLPEEAKP